MSGGGCSYACCANKRQAETRRNITRSAEASSEVAAEVADTTRTDNKARHCFSLWPNESILEFQCE